jgi:hypothetical protein
MLNTSQQRKHAALLRERDNSPEAQAVAAEIEAKAELDDAEAGRPVVVADSARMVEEYPILAKITREGGKIVEIERPWLDADAQRIEAAGVKMAFEWCHDPMAGLRQGELVYIWIGTRDDGPRVQWDRNTRKWRRHRSKGNYGRNWSHGGTWTTILPDGKVDKKLYEKLSEAAPDLSAIIGRD